MVDVYISFLAELVAFMIFKVGKPIKCIIQIEIESTQLDIYPVVISLLRDPDTDTNTANDIDTYKNDSDTNRH